MAKTVATVLGVAFLLVGVIGFVAPTVGGFHLSVAHNLVHIISGAAVLYFGLAGTLGGARNFDILFGAVYGLLGIAGFVGGSPGTPSMPNMPADDRLLTVIPGVLELGTNDHLLHILLGIIFLVAGLMTRATAGRT